MSVFKGYFFELNSNNFCSFSVFSLSPDAAGAAALISNQSISTTRRLLPPAKFPQKNPADLKLSTSDTGSLQWESWQGSLPEDAVYIFNDYASRIDYVCKVKCRSGFYNDYMGPYCHYPDDGLEYRSSRFQILVNKKNFEDLEWKTDSYGSVPRNSVDTCLSEKIYVAKNKYGLGMVYQKDECFYLPWEGSEYWYKTTYEVLTSMKGKSTEIKNVKYEKDHAKISKDSPKVLKSSEVTNRNDETLKKTVTLSQTTTEQNQWDTSSSITLGVKTSITVGIPSIVQGSLEFGVEETETVSKGGSLTEENTHTITLELNVPPKHMCRVVMYGYRYKMDIPFTASLYRTYEDGQTRSLDINGIYRGVQTGEVKAEVEPCIPIN